MPVNVESHPSYDTKVLEKNVADLQEQLQKSYIRNSELIEQNNSLIKERDTIMHHNLSIDEIKRNVVSKIPLKLINTLDGIRVNKINGWWLIRASNTEASIVIRIEGNNQNELENLILEVKSFLKIAKINWKGP